MRTTWLLVLLAECNGHGSRPDGGNGIDGSVVLVDASTDAAIDAAGFACADDSTLEPNNMISQAFATTVDATTTLTLAGLAICPANDADHYKVTLASMHALQIQVTWEGGPDLATSFLNAGGTNINEAIVKPDHSIDMCVPGLPFGTYYVKVYGASNVRNNYRLALTAKTTCN